MNKAIQAALKAIGRDIEDSEYSPEVLAGLY
jgi:hypothetical protein